jgi:hypothetical protein
MLSPPPRPHCAFGSACDSQLGGQKAGPNICTWCKNMSFDSLYRQAESHPDHRHLKRLIDSYLHQLQRDSDERIAKGWSHLCACKDPIHSFRNWRRDFNPKDTRPCGYVPHRGQLCPRCYRKARQQHCAWLQEFCGDRHGFPCVFEDPRLRGPADINWKRGPMNEQGDPDPDWEKDPRKHGRCRRTTRKWQLCQQCYNRMCEIRGFGKYFEAEWGILHERYRL